MAGSGQQFPAAPRPRGLLGRCSVLALLGELLTLPLFLSGPLGFGELLGAAHLPARHHHRHHHAHGGDEHAQRRSGEPPLLDPRPRLPGMVDQPAHPADGDCHREQPDQPDQPDGQQQHGCPSAQPARPAAIALHANHGRIVPHRTQGHAGRYQPGARPRRRAQGDCATGS